MIDWLSQICYIIKILIICKQQLAKMLHEKNDFTNLKI